jgi:hypothetical protein
MAKPKCEKCGKTIEKADLVKNPKGHWHQDCLEEVVEHAAVDAMLRERRAQRRKARSKR